MDLSNALKGKNKRVKMTHEETLVLLSCKEEGGRFCKGRGGATHWNLISEEIEKKLGSQPPPDQCRLRYDTLLKAYKTYNKHCTKTGKMFCMITEEERLELKVATTLCEEWYTTIGKICDKAKSCKRIKITPSVRSDLHPLSLHDPLATNPPAISNRRSFRDGVLVWDSVCGPSEVLKNIFQVGVLSSLNEDLQSTLLNLVQELSWGVLGLWIKGFWRLEVICRRLAILQDCESREILNYVFELWERKLVSVEDMDFEEGKDLVRIDLWEDNKWFLESWVYEEISKEVLGQNPHLKTYYNSFPIEQSSLQYVKLLSLHGCSKLKDLDLREFPNLRVLSICDCEAFNLVTGREVATSLGSLDISGCSSYQDFPNLRYLFSLREFVTHGGALSSILLDFSKFNQCTKLQRLEIWDDESLFETVDLKNLKDLKFLQFLEFANCTFSKIQGLSGLHTLKTLNLAQCENLTKVQDLGCLKGLTKLDMSFSGIQDIVGVGQLHLLTSLDLFGCHSLYSLPILGQLKALVYLDLRKTSVKEILGREGLISLKALHWDVK